MTDRYFLERKSCRNFKPEKIDLSRIEEIIRQAEKAPTCGNMQLYSVVVTKEAQSLQKLSALHYNQPAAATAPCILTVCADFNRFTKWCRHNNAKAGYDNFHSFIMAITDAVIFAQQIVTIAEKEGLASCYLGTVTYNAAEISDLLKLPEMVVPVAAISLGLPNEDGECTRRLEPEAIMHLETYREDNEEKIEDYFRVFTQDPANEKYLKENGKENLAQVFAEVRYPEATNLAISASFMELLKEKGFIKHHS